MEDFSFIADQHSRSLLVNAYQAIDQLELWSWLNTYEPEAGGGFMFSNHPNVTLIGQKMETLENPPGHSGFSFGWTMRHMRRLAKNGMEKYKLMIQNENNSR